MKQPLPNVSGEVVISAAIPPFTNGTLHLYLEDVSLADAEALTLSEITVYGITHDPFSGKGGETRVAFSFQTDNKTKIDSMNVYEVRVWLDMDGDGEEGPSDLYSTQSYPVLTQGYPPYVLIYLLYFWFLNESLCQVMFH